MHDNVLVLNDKVLILYDDMVRYWYCANTPPRSLEDKAKKKGIWSEKAERKKIGPIREGEKTRKKICLETKIFTRRWWWCVSVGGGRLGGWRVGGWDRDVG